MTLVAFGHRIPFPCQKAISSPDAPRRLSSDRDEIVPPKPPHEAPDRRRYKGARSARGSSMKSSLSEDVGKRSTEMLDAWRSSLWHYDGISFLFLMSPQMQIRSLYKAGLKYDLALPCNMCQRAPCTHQVEFRAGPPGILP